MIQEKLYLSKLDDVYVSEETSSNLMQFQKDGIRFLYIQYKKVGYLLGFVVMIINKPAIIARPPCFKDMYVLKTSPFIISLYIGSVH